MKKLMLSIFALVLAMSVNAQSDTPFEKGKVYASAGVSGLNLNYNSTTDWNMDLSAKLGYLVSDNVMLLGNAQYGFRQKGSNEFQIGVGARYYIEQNGIFMGATANYKHVGDLDDFIPSVHVGYAFFLSRTVTIEPELYYDISTKDFKNYSGVGFRVGFGIYLE